MRSIVRASVALVIVASSRFAWADVSRACIAASDSGQTLRDAGKLRQARESFLACTNQACPALIKTDCAQWLADVEARIPSVVLGAHDAAGHDVVDVRVSIDGAQLIDKLDGRALEIEPGPHVIRYVRAESDSVEERVVIREGEKRRAVIVRFRAREIAARAAMPSVRPEIVRRPIPVAAMILSGVAVAGGAVFAYEALSATRDIERMRTTCAPSCPATEVAAARTELLVANLAFGVGVASLAVATWVFLVRPARRVPATQLDVRPAGAGYVLGVGGHF